MRNYTEFPELADAENEGQFTRKPHLRPQLYNDTLQEIMEIAPETLQSNRMGRLTPSQKQALTAELKNDSDAMYLLVTIFLGVSLLLAFIFLGNGLPMLYLVLGAGTMLAWLGFYSWRRQSRLKTALGERVQRVEGAVEVYALGSIAGAQGHLLRVKDKMFRISPAIYEQLSQYELPPCRAYFAPKTNDLLSIEVLPRYAEKPKNEDLLDEAEEVTSTERDASSRLMLPEETNAAEERQPPAQSGTNQMRRK